MNALVDQAKTHTEDQTTGGGDYEDFLHPEGVTFARFVGYVEVGVREQKPWKGQPKKPCGEARFTFECNGPRSMRTIEIDGEEQTVPYLLRIKIAKKGGTKAGYVKLMRKMSYGREGIVNFGQMFDEPFMINIVHGKGKDRDGNDKTYANMRDADGNFTIGAAMTTDPLSNEVKRFDVPASVTDLSYFTWDHPTTEQWQSIFIDGERTVKDKEGNEVVESKNWLQRDIVTNASNFQGSPLEALLNGMQDLTMPSEDPGAGMVPDAEEMKMAAEKLEQEQAASMASKAIAAVAAEVLAPNASAPVDKATSPDTTASAATAVTVESEKPTDASTPTVDAKAKAIADAQAIIDKLMAG